MYRLCIFVWFTTTDYGNCHRFECIYYHYVITTFVISLNEQFENKVYLLVLTYFLTYLHYRTILTLI